MVWTQVYDPLNSMVLSTICAAIPVVVMLGGLAFFHLSAHVAAIAGLVSSLLVAVLIYGMPAPMAGMAAVNGGLFGLLPIGWIVLNIIFLYQLTKDKGYFQILQDSIANITDDRRLQLLLIAFAFGAFFEGASGFGTPVAITGSVLIGLGFSPLAASGLALIANTAPVAYGALGTPVITLAKVTGLDEMMLSSMIGRQLPFFSLLVPFWLIWAFAGRKGMLQIWPAILVAGGSFAIAQFVVSNYHGPMLVDVIASLVSMASLIAFLKVWKPKKIWTSAKLIGHEEDGGEAHPAPMDIPQKADKAAVRRAWMPWVILTVFVFIWGLPEFKKAVDTVPVLENGLAVLDAKGNPKVTGNTFLAPVFRFDDIHEKIEKVPPVVAKSKKEEASYKLNWFTTTGTGILLAALFAGLLMGYRPLQLASQFGKTVWMVRYSLTTIVAMLALGYLTRFAGIDATLGLAFAFTGVFYPFFGTFLGWLGVALTGSDTASNVLFGGLQRTTAEQLGISPVLMAAANSSGGVMGKMIDAQSIVVASTATHWYGHEGEILRYVFFHSIALCTLMGLFITAQAYVWPFTAMVLK